MPYRLGGTIYQTREESQAAVMPFIRQIQQATTQGRAAPGLTATQRQMVNDWEAILEAEEEQQLAQERMEEMAEMGGNGNWGNGNMGNGGLNQPPGVNFNFIPDMGVLNIPEGSENAITRNTIEEGNALVNFRGNDPRFESSFGRFYRQNTVGQLHGQHPQTREQIQNYHRYSAHIVPRANNRSPRARKSRKNRKSRKSRRNNRK